LRFTSQQDINLFLHFNKELINTFIDVQVVIYKLNIQESKKNIYGESTTKRWFVGVQIPALVDRQSASAVNDAQTINVEQSVDIHLLRSECQLRDILPEPGDIIGFDNNYFEINTTNDVQIIGGQPIYNHSITCSCHLTRNTNLNFEAPTL
jgi:hypothetical protein